MREITFVYAILLLAWLIVAYFWFTIWVLHEKSAQLMIKQIKWILVAGSFLPMSFVELAGHYGLAYPYTIVQRSGGVGWSESMTTTYTPLMTGTELNLLIMGFLVIELSLIWLLPWKTKFASKKD